ncbi:MAG: serine O-acetyltransferase [Opitutales bacterium]
MKAPAETNLWPEIRGLAEALHTREPALAPLVQEVILDHPDLGASLSFRLARKFGRLPNTELRLRETFQEAFQADPAILEHVGHDIRAIYERDPACPTVLVPVLFYKGFQAITAYRIAHWLWHRNRHDLALYVQSLVSEAFAVDIHPAARIGCGILLDHATSFVAGETAVVENNVSILHEVTLGGTGRETGDRHPKIRSGVLIGAGAKILGNIEIGTGAKIGAGSVVLTDVEPHTTVAGVPAVVVGRTREDMPAADMDQHLC